jgi:hypothetical protein
LTKDVIIWLQKILNPASLEQWAAANNIKIPIGQIVGMYIKTVLNSIVPLSGAVVNYISSDIQAFIKKDPDQIIKEMSTPGSGIDVTSDLNFDLFGTKFTISGSDNTWLYIGAGALVLILGYAFLKA